MKRLWAAAMLVALVVVASACRVEVAVDLDVSDQGSATVTVTMTASRDVLAVVPRLADDLVVDDLTELGWTVEGPTPTSDGGLSVVLTRTTADLGELRAALADLGTPLDNLQVSRADEFARTTWQLTGRSVLNDGTAGLVDPDTLAALGAAPFVNELTESGRSLEQVMDVTLRVRLPGELTSTTGEVRDGAIVWQLPVDGTLVSLEATTERTDRGASVARSIADITRFVLVVWVLVGVTFVAWVLFARRRRRLARLYRNTPSA